LNSNLKRWFKLNHGLTLEKNFKMNSKLSRIVWYSKLSATSSSQNDLAPLDFFIENF
jgi:hypothetical protein